jgi:NAD-dependent deacetylase
VTNLDAAVDACRTAIERPGTVVALTGAGVSAESGIPTFRGEGGYWTIGSSEYRSEDLATYAAFSQMPWDVWAWYLYRRTVCREAAPNAAHAALVEWDTQLGDRFSLVTQNVDGLHRRAGSPDVRLHEIHGDIDLMRCSRECTFDRYPIPAGVPRIAKGAKLSESTRSLLRCPKCGAVARPHVLWFDESYDEPRYRLDTVRSLASRAALVVIAGTSASTNLPWQVVSLAQRNGAAIVDVNTAENPFAEVAAASAGAIRAPASEALPAIVRGLT